ncbi:UbiD family decarboxylase [Legionella saoudiensis]|uniref:UbiD family decarboxylase n=1 Tax=Legionella saoudiensis TaxID=1750561 RepID=UPI000730A9FA|nr:UbiD family decarboxylase [Legionella saoudiensis]
MPYKDFRQFIEALRKNGELIEVKRPIDLATDVGKALQKSASISGPAVQFSNNGTNFPLIGGLYNSRKKTLIAFQADEASIFKKILDGLAHPIEPILTDNAVTHEQIILEDAVDLSQFPIPKYSPSDGGQYITAGIAVSKDPETGIEDIGNYRFQIISKNTMSFLAQPNHRLGKNLEKARKLGHKKYPIALVIGVDPVIAYTCQFQLQDDTNDFAVAGGLRGEAVVLTSCKTIDVQVPAYAEVVFELEIDLEELVFEGPLGEYTGYYTPGSMKPTAHVKAITHRNNAYFQALLTGVPPTENHFLKQIPFEASFFKSMNKSFPTISNVAIPASGGVSFYIVLAIEPRFDGEARQAILAAMASNLRPKMVVAVNSDINIHDADQVTWATSFRMQPHKDIIIINNLPAGPLDPSILDDIPLDARLASSIGIDATYPFGSLILTPETSLEKATPHAGQLCFKVADIPGWRDYDFPELTKYGK